MPVTWLCLKRINRVTGTFTRGPKADVPVTRESQNFALRGREVVRSTMSLKKNHEILSFLLIGA